MEIHYFSWLRSRIGAARETVSPPPEVTTPGKLVDWLSGRDSRYRSLFAHPGAVTISVNDRLVEDWENHALQSDDKISFFSPMSGG